MKSQTVVHAFVIYHIRRMGRCFSFQFQGVFFFSCLFASQEVMEKATCCIISVSWFLIINIILMLWGCCVSVSDWKRQIHFGGGGELMSFLFKGRAFTFIPFFSFFTLMFFFNAKRRSTSLVTCVQKMLYRCFAIRSELQRCTHHEWFTYSVQSKLRGVHRSSHSVWWR